MIKLSQDKKSRLSRIISLLMISSEPISTKYIADILGEWAGTIHGDLMYLHIRGIVSRHRTIHKTKKGEKETYIWSVNSNHDFFGSDPETPKIKRKVTFFKKVDS